MAENTIEDFRGRSVIDTRGTRIGEVEDLLFDPANWEVRGLLVNLRKEVADDLHVDKPAFGSARLNISRERVQTLGENVMLNVNTDDIAGLLRGGSGARGGSMNRDEGPRATTDTRTNAPPSDREPRL